MILGLVLLVVAGDYLVDSASGIAKHFGLPSLIIGMTVVAFGTSAPELLVSVMGGLNGHSAIALGNVTGSNTINVSIIVGMTALICPFYVARESINRDCMFLLGITVIACLLGFAGNELSRLDGAILLAMTIAFVYWTINKSINSGECRQTEDNRDEKDEKTRGMAVNIVILILSLAGLSFGADLVVDSATQIATALGISERIISVTIVAIGTSLPELTASIISALKKQPDLTIGNIIGSNIFNIGFVLGCSTMAAPIPLSEDSAISMSQYAHDTIWMFGFEFMLLIGMINVTNNWAMMKEKHDWKELFSTNKGLVGRIWGFSALALYAGYLYLILSKDY